MNNLINQDEVPTTEALAEVGAELTIEFLSKQYARIYNYVMAVFDKCTVDAMLKPYFMVFKPLNARYDATIVDHKGLTSILTWARKQEGSFKWLITKEKLSEKIHFNMVLFSSAHDFEQRYHEKVFANKYKIYCKPVVDLESTVQYILKEARERKFEHYIDWDLKARSVKCEVPLFKVPVHNLPKRSKTVKPGKRIYGPFSEYYYITEGPVDRTSVAPEAKSVSTDLSPATE